MKSWVLALPLLFLSLSAHAQDGWPAPPSHVVESVRAELLHNPGLNDTDLRRYLAGAYRLAGRPEILAWAVSPRLLRDSAQKQLLKPFEVEYYEIPEKIFTKLGTLIGNPVDGGTIKFSRGGENYVRFFVHPLNEASEIPQLLKSVGATEDVCQVKRGLYRAFFTSSRSLYINRKGSQKWGSLKPSLPKGPGPFPDKVYPTGHANLHSSVSQMVSDLTRGKLPPGTAFLGDGEGSGIRVEGRVDEAQLTRRVPAFERGEILYPLSVMFDPVLSVRIARANGFNDTARFWRERVMKSEGGLAAVLAHEAGVAHSSLHSQNMVIAVDQGLKLKEVGVRDSDFDIDSEVWRARQQGAHHETNLSLKLALSVGVETHPPWMSQDVFVEMVDAFFDEAGRKIGELEGRPPLVRASRLVKNGDTYLHKTRKDSSEDAVGHFSVSLPELRDPPRSQVDPRDVLAAGAVKRAEIAALFPEWREWVTSPTEGALRVIQSGDMNALEAIPWEVRDVLDFGLTALGTERGAARLVALAESGGGQHEVLCHMLRRSHWAAPDVLMQALIRGARGVMNPDLAEAMLDRGQVFHRPEFSLETKALFVESFGMPGVEFMLKNPIFSELFTEPDLMKQFIFKADPTTLDRLEKEISTGMRVVRETLYKQIPDVHEWIRQRRSGICFAAGFTGRQ